MTIHIPTNLIETLRTGQTVTVLTGAGVSAESGVPTFRAAQTGLWAEFKPQDLATPEAFRRNPKMVWEWYAWRREQLADVQPNPAHYALAAMAQYVPNFHLLTQNVDGLHQMAGSPEVIELHGNIRRTKCFNEGTHVDTWQSTDEVPPRCPHCGGWLRPDVVWFGENLPAEALNAAAEAAATCDIFFAIGTSGLVEPAASLLHVAVGEGALGVIINPERMDVPPSILQINAPAGEALPALLQALTASLPNARHP